MIRLTRLQNTLADSGLLTREQLSLYIQHGKSEYTSEVDEHVFRMDYQAVLWITNFTSELWLLALILEDSVQEIWPSNCTRASVERMETDPLNTPETDVAFIIHASETFRLTPIAETLPEVTCVKLSSGLFRVDAVDMPDPHVLKVFRGMISHAEPITG